MEFKDFDELKKYIKKRAMHKTKYLLNLSKIGKIDTSKGTLMTIYKASLHEVQKEILEEIKNGTIVILNQEKNKKRIL